MTSNRAETGQSNSNQWASREFQAFKDDDPRAVAARAVVREARKPERLFLPGNQPQTMRVGVEHSVG
jgi:hypothetical protein